LDDIAHTIFQLTNFTLISTIKKGMALDATSISFTFSERAITLLDYDTGAATSITASPLHTPIAIRLTDETLITLTALYRCRSHLV
jgi:hypothetical protein